ncbi:hypothetical protein SEA_ARGAN_87 [Arthrobacter phage Argan]|nr:hypothetical protein SEA_UZUMAKI_87 [Arthrobacter phage Uzumaki]WNT45471.1 hypothetical protein SEA_ARGAN_87 [Arthrobacter phage Argan]
MGRRVAEAKEPNQQEKAMRTQGFEPTKWWRAEDVDGHIVAETSNPHDWVFQDLIGQKGIRILRLYQKVDYIAVEEIPE